MRFQNPTTGAVVEQEGRSPQDLANQGFVPVASNTVAPITSENLTPTTSIPVLPTPNINTGAGIIAGGNAEITALAGATTPPETVPAPVAPTAPSYDDEIGKLLAGVAAPIAPPVEPNYAGEYQTSNAYQKEQAIAEKERLVNEAKLKVDTYNAQLKGIENKAREESLILENQNKAAGVNARVITLLNREQQEINRRAAIEALPIQAMALQAQGELAHAQGNLQGAQNIYQMALGKFDKAFELKMDYQDKMYQYNKDQRKAMYNYLTTKEKARVDALQEADDLKNKQTKTNSTLAQNWVAQAMKVGAADLANQLTQLDPLDINFTSKLAAIQSQIITKQEANNQMEEQNKLAKSGYTYVATPAERDRLKGLGYDILEQSGRTYAKAPTPVKVSGGGSGGRARGGGGAGGGGDDGTSDFDFARQIIDANSDVSDIELKTGLLEQVSLGNIKMSVTEINSLIDERKQKAKATAEANKPQSFSQDWFKSKIAISRSNDFSDTEIIDYIIKNFDINELFKTAKETGYAKWYTGKETDIKRYIKSLL